jgi:DNA (cytosine-5)-methyltransferase 1
MKKDLIVDIFAGGGGVSTGIFQATGRHPDIAINHNDDALSMHRVNHPHTRHFIADVYEVCPKGATQGRPVSWLHLSPDCTHHSQAAGGQPRSKKLRGLAWVGYRWAGQVMPAVISLENVTQILKWGPLIAKRDKATGRVITLDLVQCPETGKMINRVAEPGERVPVQQQFLTPDPKRVGQTWQRFCASLRALGYQLESRTLCAADFGAPTTRERLFMIARLDGLPIAWPEPTHSKTPAYGQQKWRGASECIDFNIQCQSIFDRKKPLAAATMRRIAKGLKRYVLDSADPFIVPIAHYNGRDTVYPSSDPLRTITAATKGGEFALAAPVIVPATHQGSDRINDIKSPLPTVTCANRGELMVTAPILVQAAHGEGTPGKTQRWGSGVKDVIEPLGTLTASGEHALSTVYLAQMNGGFNETVGRDPRSPMTTITNTGSQQQVVAAYLAQLRNNCDSRSAEEPIRTISAAGQHHAAVVAFLSRQFGNSVGQSASEPAPTIMTGGAGKTAVVSAFISSYYTDESNRSRSIDDPAATITTENRLGLVECTLSPEHHEGAQRVAAFLMRYYSEGGQHSNITDPMTTITTKDRMALVTVMISGQPHVIVDIGLRMLQPAELFRAQGFPDNYEIEQGHDGRKFTKSTQVRLCGNSVPPSLMEAICRANYPQPTENLDRYVA